MSAPHDAAFEKYRKCGAYHWREIGGHWMYHNAFTAERYRRVIEAAQPLSGKRVLDYGCGDGALLSWIAKTVNGGEAVGFDPNEEAQRLASEKLAERGVRASVVSDLRELEDGSFDRVLCSEVIEHVHDVQGLLAEIHRVLRPGGRAVLTTPIRMTESPEDPNHVREWFPSEFASLLGQSPLALVEHRQILPAASAEVFFWRPRIFLRVPVFRVLCNLLSIYANVNAMSWLGVRPRLFMTQIAVLEKAGREALQ